MKNLVIIFILLCLVACKQNKKEKEITKDNSIEQKDSLTNELNKIYDRNQFKGFSVAIVNEDKILYQKGFGYADIKSKKAYSEKTIQPIASISKVLIGISLLKAQEMNKLNLDDPINKYLPFEIANPNFPNIPITIRQLATHTSSIQDKDFYWYHSYILKNVVNKNSTNDSIPFYFKEQKNAIDLADFLQKRFEKSGEWYNSDIYLNKKPNEVYEYSNIGSALCAYVIELATETPYNDFTRQNILKPLDMKSSGWFFNEVNFDNYATIYSNSKIIPPYSLITYPDGGFITSSEDLAKLLTEFIKGYNGKGTLLNENSYKEIFKSQVKDIPKDEDVEKIGIFIEFGEEGIGHSGGDPGINSLMFFNPKTNIGRILMTNTDSSKDELGNDFWEIWNTMEKQEIE